MSSSDLKKYKKNQDRLKAGRKRKSNQGPDIRLMIASALAVAIVVWVLRTNGFL